MRIRLLTLLLLTWFLAACGRSEPDILRLATTTSTYDSGLLETILPDFEATYDARVDVVAVGTGQAIALGEAGDADVILVHARSREEAFVAERHGTARYDVMYNDFVIVGPPADPAGIHGLTQAKDALAAIAQAEAPFASRGDDSGTHTKEMTLWAAAGLSPDANDVWYRSLGQGMGSTLTFANEDGDYALTDRGTFLSMRANLHQLEILVGGRSIDENEDDLLRNPYGVIPVNPQKGAINHELALAFVDWITSVKTQQAIAEYGKEQFGQALFYPNSTVWLGR